MVKETGTVGLCPQEARNKFVGIHKRGVSLHFSKSGHTVRKKVSSSGAPMESKKAKNTPNEVADTRQAHLTYYVDMLQFSLA